MAQRDALKNIEQVLPEAFKGAAPAPVNAFPRRFSFTQPEREHGIGDTLRYAQAMAEQTWADPEKQRLSIMRYAATFAETSRVMQQLDQDCPPIMRAVRAQTYPNVIVDLARTIPLDPDGSTKSRVAFIAEYFGRSQTFKSHIAKHGYETLPIQLVNEANAVWAVYRAFRSLDEAGRDSLVFALGPHLPKFGYTMLANMRADFTPFLAASGARPDQRAPA